MTWQDAKSDARNRIALMTMLPPAGKRLDGLTIVLTDYEDSITYRFLCGMNGWSLDYFRMVNNAAARILRKRGAIVEYRTVKLDDYIRWLFATKQDNTPDSRAAFAATATPEPVAQS